MSYVINDPECNVIYGNTGIPACPIDPGLIYGGALVDTSFSLTPTEVLTIKAQLQAAAVADGKARLFPLPRYEDIVDGTEDPTEETLGLGASLMLREGKMVKTIRFLKGGLCLLKNLRTFNTKDNIGIFHYATELDGKHQIIGTLDSDGKLRPMALNQFYAYPVKLSDGKVGNQYRAKISEENPSDWDNYGVVQVDFDPLAEVKGVVDLVLEAATPVTDTVVITVKTKCDLVNVYDDLSTLLADPDAWVATKDGVAVTIDGVAVEPITKGFTLQITGATGDHVITLATAAALAVLGIGGGNSNGYEASNSETVTLTAGS